jgi:hypothetical protein
MPPFVISADCICKESLNSVPLRSLSLLTLSKSSALFMACSYYPKQYGGVNPNLQVHASFPFPLSAQSPFVEPLHAPSGPHKFSFFYSPRFYGPVATSVLVLTAASYLAFYFLSISSFIALPRRFLSPSDKVLTFLSLNLPNGFRGTKAFLQSAAARSPLVTVRLTV